VELREYMMCKGRASQKPRGHAPTMFSCCCVSDICWPVATDKVALGCCQYDTENTRFPCVSQSAMITRDVRILILFLFSLRPC